MKKLDIAAAFILALTMPLVAQAAEHTVEMVDSETDNYFQPRKLTIQSGDTVTWVNTGMKDHNVMAESIPLNAEAFQSPMLEETDAKWSYTFTKPGTYRYHCHPHQKQGMAGTIIVNRPSKADEVKEIGHEHHH